MELILSIVSFLWLITILVVVKCITNVTISVNVKHENAVTPLDFNDFYDKDGDVKKEHTLEDTFNDVFKEFNELITGEEVVKTDG